ncbi:MAG TPA: hypothetical protein VGH68_15595 [Paraburkholderia sp.]|jgi:allophanate hydrolase
MPLEGQIKQPGVRFVEATVTSPRYRLFTLADTQPPKPGVVRTYASGHAIAIELCEMPMRAFVASARLPLSPESGARDVTSRLGWRGFQHSLASTSHDQPTQEATS